MRFSLKRILIFLLTFSLFQINISHAREIKSLNIITSPEIAVMVSELARIYSLAENVNVSGNFDNLDELINDVEYGLPADLIITSHESWIKTLKQKGLIDVTSTEKLFYDKLIFYAVNSNVKFPRFSVIENFPDYKYIYSVLNNTAVSLYQLELNKVEPTLKKLSNLQLVETRDPIAKILLSNPKFFSTDFYSIIYDDNRFKIIAEVEKDAIVSIFYSASIIAGENSDIAEDFLDFLQSKDALEVYKKYGFNSND